jgi:hypothetical protein
VAPFHQRFAGLVMLADWLGSHPLLVSDWAGEYRRALGHRPRGRSAVALGDRARPDVYALQRADFGRRFDLTPRPLQAVIDALDLDDEAARLLITESETGSGKTEAALHWFAQLFAAGKVDGLYFAPCDVLMAPYHATWADGNEDQIVAEVEHLAEAFEAMSDVVPGEKALLVIGDFNLVPEILADAMPAAERTAGTGSTLNSRGARRRNL